MQAILSVTVSARVSIEYIYLQLGRSIPKTSLPQIVRLTYIGTLAITRLVLTLLRHILLPRPHLPNLVHWGAALELQPNMGQQIKEEQNYAKQPFLLPVQDIVQYLQTDVEFGLSSAQVKQYQDKYGANKLDGDGGIPWYALLMKQIANAMILVS
jgi:hypothetical protein